MYCPYLVEKNAVELNLNTASREWRWSLNSSPIYLLLQNVIAIAEITNHSGSSLVTAD